MTAGPGAPLASTLDLSAHEAFLHRGIPLRRVGEGATVRLQLLLVWRILRAARRRLPLVLYSSRGSLKPDLIACVLLGLLPRRHRPPSVLVGEMWQPGSGLRAAVERLVVRLADRAIDRYLVLSQAEADRLPATWPVDARKMRVRPFYFDPAEHGLREDDPLRPRGRHVVAGGDSFRDYGPLLEAARQRPDLEFLIVSKVLDGVPLPPNVEVRTVPYAEYVQLLRDAGVVVVPVRTDLDRSAGILTFVMAMWLGRPTVVSRALAVDEYVDDGETGVLVDGDAASWLGAIDRLLGDQEEAERLAVAGRKAVQERFTFDAYVRGVLGELDAVVAARTAEGSWPPAPDDSGTGVGSVRP